MIYRGFVIGEPGNRIILKDSLWDLCKIIRGEWRHPGSYWMILE